MNNTFAKDVYSADIDGDAKKEVITVGYYMNYTDGRANRNAQLRVWNFDQELTLRDIKQWYAKDQTEINSLHVGDVDSDGVMEIVTAGNANNDRAGQVTIWSYQSSEPPSPTPPGRSDYQHQAVILIPIIITAAVAIFLFRRKHSEKDDVR